MAVNELGVSFLDPFGKRRRETGDPVGDGRTGSAVQILALQLPRILGNAALAPRQLLDPSVKGTLAPVSQVGPRASALAESIASSVVNNVTRQGAPVGTNLLGLGVQPQAPAAVPSIVPPQLPVPAGGPSLPSPVQRPQQTSPISLPRPELPLPSPSPAPPPPIFTPSVSPPPPVAPAPAPEPPPLAPSGADEEIAEIGRRLLEQLALTQIG